MSGNDEITDTEKVRIACDFLQHAPPGEFNEVFNDVRVLLNSDTLLKEHCASAFTQYNKDQFTPVQLDGASKQALITQFNELGNGRFLDPRTKQSFRFDHLRKEASEVESGTGSGSSSGEAWRSALESALDAYVENHFKHGIAAVFVADAPGGGGSGGVPNVTLTICIEAHQYQPKNFWNGRWRSQWSTQLTEKSVELKGVLKVQVHYYEDGNVQLVTSKEISKRINVTNEAATAKEIVKVIEEEETAYQMAVSENYKSMSDSVFKSLRRQLPVTRTKIDWSKILNYKIGAELKPGV
jgi:capping protein alpha